jgi:hypothetical protein
VDRKNTENVKDMAEELEKKSEIVLYQTEDGRTQLEVRLEHETVWLTQGQMAELFQTTIPNVSMHIRNVFSEGELKPDSVVKESLTTAADGKNYQTKFFNLDVIISVGYRVKSLRGTQFRIWATQRLREYIVKGFTLDDERLKQGGGKYFDELTARIREIRASEKNFYQKIKDIYATSADYDEQAEITQDFFAMAQNKLHWAIHRHTAAEVIAARANAGRPHMGLTTWSGSKVRKDADTSIVPIRKASSPRLLGLTQSILRPSTGRARSRRCSQTTRFSIIRSPFLQLRTVFGSPEWTRAAAFA